MPRTARRRKLTPILAVLLFAGSSLGPSGDAAVAHDKTEDPWLYGEPHAGWTAPPRGTGRLAPTTGTLLGVHPEDSHSNPITEEHQHIITTENRLDRRMDINNSFYGGFDDIADKYDPGNPNKRGLSPLAYWDLEMGRIPLISWGCKGIKTKDIAAGKHDEVIRKTAAAFKDFGEEIFVRWCWEMDGSKRISTVGDPEDLVAAHVHIWKTFQAEGATNVVWVWCANANTFKNKNDKGRYAWDYYPGDEYVDWVSADGYNWGAARRGGDRWRGFIEIFDEFMVWARSTGEPAAAIPMHSAPDQFPRKREVKPIMIAEYGVIEDDDDHERKAKWMRETHDTVNGEKPRTEECPHCGVYSDIAALVYFDINANAAHQNGDWRIISSDESQEAYDTHAAHHPWFDRIHTIGWGPAANRPDAPPQSAQPPASPPPSGGTPADPAPAGPQPTAPPSSPGPGAAPQAPSRSGYWMLGADGAVFPFGDAADHGQATTRVAAGTLAAVDVEPTPTGDGYWVVDADGRVSPFGDAGFFGGVDAGALPAGEEATSLSATPTGRGYWVFTTAGRVRAFGDAAFLGDMSGTPLNGPVLDSVPTPTGQGYYMVASDGGIFTFGDAAFHGSMGDVPLNAPVQSLVPGRDGAGYWLVAADGGVFAFEAPFRGSMGGSPLNQPVTGMVRFGDGYLMVATDGGIFNFSDRPFAGSLGDRPPTHPIVAVAVLGRE